MEISLGLRSIEDMNEVSKLKKTLYVLTQCPHACFGRPTIKTLS